MSDALPVGDAVDTDDADIIEVPREDMIRESIGYTVFSSAIARFMPTDSAIMFPAEEIAKNLKWMGVSTDGYEDVVRDIVLVNSHDPETGLFSIAAISPESFYESLDLYDYYSREYIESLLRDGKLVRFDNELEDEEEDDDN